jgi:hypothetical protein
MIETHEQIENKPTCERNCHVCANSHFNSGQWLMSMTGGWPSGLSCASCSDAPGRLMDVTCCRLCANFRRKRPASIPRTPKESDDDAIRFVPLSRGLYATRHDKHRLVLMHRFIMNPPPDKCVDHFDGNA